MRASIADARRHRTHQEIGRRLAGQQVVRHADRMLRTGGDHLIDIGAERQHLLPTIAGPVEFDGDERRVLDLDAAALGRGFQPERAVRLALQHAGEQADQLLARDRTAAIQPGAVAPDQEGQIAAFHRHARRGRARAHGTWRIRSQQTPHAAARAPGPAPRHRQVALASLPSFTSPSFANFASLLVAI